MQNVSRLIDFFIPEHYELSLNLEREKRVFSGTVTIRGEKISDTPIRLHAKDLEFHTIRINGVEANNFHPETNDEVAIDEESPAGKTLLYIEFEGTITDAMHGLYPCYYEVEGEKKELLATQFESHHAREVFPCIDEPEAKATFDLTLITEEGVEILSNMPIASQDGATTTFETTPRMSTYLLAWVVGDLHKKTAMTKSGVEVNVWATKAQPSSLLDFPLDVAVRSIDFFDEYFDEPYPLPKADHVALPDFSSGAMENWGLITYREVCLLADKKTAQSTREWIATVIAHETSHQWFGNLVTMKWWDDLWLNESFATVMEYIAVDALFPSWNAWDNFASAETLSALRRDQLAGVQAVKVDVYHPDEISTLFDSSIVYAKGARLLKMLRAYVGDDVFRQGLKTYFNEYKYQNTTGDDLWMAISNASGKDIKSFMDGWLTQSGLPIISVTTTDSGYSLTQKRFVIGEQVDARTWQIPLHAYQTDFPALLAEKEITFNATHELPLLNTENSAHFVTKYDEAALDLVLDGLSSGKLSTQDRLALLHETSLLTKCGEISTANIVNLLKKYANETHEPVWNIIGMIVNDLKRFVENDDAAEKNLKSLVVSLCLPLFEKLGISSTANESEQDVKLRASIIGLLGYADYQAVLEWATKRFAQTNLTDLERETRAIVFSLTAKHGSDDEFQKLLRLHDTTSDPDLRADIVSGVTATRSETQITQLLERLTDSKHTKPQDIMSWYINLLRNRFARESTWQWMIDNWGWIEKTFAGDKSYDDFVRYSASILSASVWLKRYQEFFGPLSSQPALKRAYDIGLTDIRTRAEWLERDMEAVKAALAQQI